MEAVRLLAVVVSGADADTRRSIAAELARSLADEQGDVREEAAKALGSVGPEARGVVPSLRKLLKDPSADVRSAAAEALRKLRSPATGAGRRQIVTPSASAGVAGANAP